MLAVGQRGPPYPARSPDPPPPTELQVWRLITGFFYMGPFSINWVFEMIWLLTYGGKLESQTFQFDPAECLLMYLFGGGSVLVVSLLCEVLGLGVKFVFNAGSIIFMLLYVWSRNFPEAQVRCWGAGAGGKGGGRGAGA